MTAVPAVALISTVLVWAGLSVALSLGTAAVMALRELGGRR